MANQEIRITSVIDDHKTGPFQARVVWLCAMIGFVEGFVTNSAGYTAPSLSKAWSIPHSALGLFFSIGLTGLMLGALIVAPIADRVGRKPILIGCLLLFGLGSLSMSASPSFDMLRVAWFVTGLGIGGAMPNAIALVSEYAPHRVRSLMIILAFNGFVAGSISSGIAARFLIKTYGWQAVFLVGGLLPLVLVPVLVLMLPESVRFLARRPDRVAKLDALMRRIRPSLPAGDVQFTDDSHTGSVSVAALFCDGRARRTLLLWGMVFCSLLDLFLMSTWLPTQIASLGVSVSIAIVIGTLLQIGGMLGAVLGWVLDRLGPGRTLAAAYMLGAVSIAGIALVGDNVPLLALSVLCAGFGILGAQTAANAVVAVTYPPEIRSTGVGWYFGVGRIGSIVGPTVAGVLLSSGVSNQNVFLLATLPALGAAVAAFCLDLPVGRRGPAR